MDAVEGRVQCFSRRRRRRPDSRLCSVAPCQHHAAVLEFSIWHVQNFIDWVEAGNVRNHGEATVLCIFALQHLVRFEARLVVANLNES